LRDEKIGNVEKEIEEKLRVQKELEGMKSLIGDDVEKKVNEKKVLHESLIEKYQEIKVKIKNLEDTIQQLSSLGGVCPICDSKLTEEKKKFLAKQKQLQINALKSMLEEIIERRMVSEKELRKIEEDAKRLDMMTVDIGNLGEASKELEEAKRIYLEMSESAKTYEAELEKIKKILEKVEEERDGTSTMKQECEILIKQFDEYDEKKRRLEELVKSRDDVENKIKIVEMKIVGKNIDDLEKMLRDLIAEERELETKILSSVQLAKEKEGRIKEYEMKLNNAFRQREEIKKMGIFIKELKIFARALEQTQIELRREFVETVNYSMTKLWTTLYPYEDFVSIRLSVEEGDYMLQLCERSGRWVNVEGVVSGGERSIACLALRIAFSLVLAPQMRTLILDEPTANLDASAIDVLAKTLRERIYEFVDQCFIITHQSELEEAVTGRAYRLERDKKRDETTKVVLLS
jgi:exonuclease SbcC